jgi:hypothetical protein
MAAHMRKADYRRNASFIFFEINKTLIRDNNALKWTNVYCIKISFIHINKCSNFLLSFSKSAVQAVASRIFRGLIFAVVQPGQLSITRRMHAVQIIPVVLQSFTNEWRISAHMYGVSRHGMVCLLHQ